MKMQIERFGKRLAIELPEALVERFRLREGDEIDAAAIEAALEAHHQEVRRRRGEALKRIKSTRWTLPPDWKFDREEANWRPAMDRWQID